MCQTQKEEKALSELFIKAFLVANDPGELEYSRLTNKVEVSTKLLDDLMAAILKLADEYLPEDLELDLLRRRQAIQQAKDDLNVLDTWRTFERLRKGHRESSGRL
jgi:hypothetical protein